MTRSESKFVKARITHFGDVRDTEASVQQKWLFIRPLCSLAEKNTITHQMLLFNHVVATIGNMRFKESSWRVNNNSTAIQCPQALQDLSQCGNRVSQQVRPLYSVHLIRNNKLCILYRNRSKIHPLVMNLRSSSKKKDRCIFKSCDISLKNMPTLHAVSLLYLCMHVVILQCFFLFHYCLWNNSKWCLSSFVSPSSCTLLS